MDTQEIYVKGVQFRIFAYVTGTTAFAFAYIKAKSYEQIFVQRYVQQSCVAS